MREKIEFLGETDWDDIPMYKIENNVYVSADGNICLLEATGFIETDYVTACRSINEETMKLDITNTVYDPENIRYKGHIIDTISDTIDGERYYEISSEDLESDLGGAKAILNDEELAMLLREDVDILVYKNSRSYIYDGYTSAPQVQDEEGMEILDILEDVLYDTKMEYLPWEKLLEKINS